MEDIVPVFLALFVGFFGGAIFWGLKTPKHCGLIAQAYHNGYDVIALDENGDYIYDPE